MNEPFELADLAIKAGDWAEAVQHLRKGLARQPDAFAYAKLAYCLSRLGRDREALAAADTGLRLEPGLTTLRDLRATIAAQSDNAAPITETAPSHTGEDLTADGHVERGWEALHEQHPAEALEHFRTALALDPGQELARVGMIEALKAGNVFIRLLLGGLALFHRLARFSFLVFLGLFFFGRRVQAWALANPGQAVWAYALLTGGTIFLILTWIAEPLVNLVLRLSRYGRLALTPEQVAAANWVGVCLFLALGCLVWALVGGGFVGWIGVGVCGLLMVPAAALFSVRRGWPRWVLALYTSLLASVGVGSVILLAMALEAQGVRQRELIAGSEFCLIGFIIGLFLHKYLQNFLMIFGGQHRD